MKLIRKLGTRLNKNGIKESWGVFECPFDVRIVERQLSNGKKDKSCGCQEGNKKHGETNTKLYRVWANIKTRCFNSKNEFFKDYGGRGITVCPEWIESYVVFRDWSFNNGYKEGLTIDRIENDLGYSPKNCQWITQKENNRKKQQVKLTQEIANEIRYLHNTGDYTMKYLAKRFCVTQGTISGIIRGKIYKNA